jgi:hypothetical protein
MPRLRFIQVCPVFTTELPLTLRKRETLKLGLGRSRFLPFRQLSWPDWQTLRWSVRHSYYSARQPGIYTVTGLSNNVLWHIRRRHSGYRTSVTRRHSDLVMVDGHTSTVVSGQRPQNIPCQTSHTPLLLSFKRNGKSVQLHGQEQKQMESTFAHNTTRLWIQTCSNPAAVSGK